MLSCFKCMKNGKKSHGQDNIYVLDFSHHSLQDVPPEIFDYERTLTELNLGSNRIIDLPPQLFLCHELKILWLNSNDITNIPPAIGSLSNLITLDLFRNNLMYSSIPDNIKQLKQLKYLNLSVNLLEKLPDSVTCLINLEELFLNDAALEYLQANFGRLVRLKILELRDNRLVTLTKSMSRLKNLVRIDLGHNKFSDFPDVICSFENLQELLIDENTIETLPDDIMNLRRLIYFDCSVNDLIEIPREIQYLSRLLDLNLSGNSIRTLPKTIGGLSNLVTLKLDNNKLTKLPDVFNDMKNLEELTLNDNFLTHVPPTIGRLRKLKFLTLDNNLIEILPTEIASCIGLTILSCRGNNLVELPPDIGHLVNLCVLNIVNNNLRYLPLSILNLSKLSALWISDNQSKPMVQLQKDHDGDFNFYLTCYMLPQCKSNRQEFLSESSDDDLLNGNNTNNYNYDSPKLLMETAKPRRICFSNDSGIQIDRPGKLMRSPTPYPKELRTMAKALNTNKIHRPPSSVELRFNDPTNATSSATQVQIKEARISANIPTVNPSSTHEDENHETSSLLHSQTSDQHSQHHIHHQHHSHIPYNPSYSIQNPLDITQNHFMPAPQPNIDDFDSASSYCQSQIELNINANIKNSSDYDDMLSLNSSVSQDNHHHHHHLHHPNAYNQHQLPHLQPPPPVSSLSSVGQTNQRRYSNSIYDNQSPNNHLYGNTHFINKLNVHENSNNLNPQNTVSTHSPSPPMVVSPPQQTQNTPSPLPRVPPPYHIAKIHSKISQQDLIIYDSIRNRNNIGNVYENTKDLQKDPNYVSPRPQQNNNLIINHNNQQQLQESHSLLPQKSAPSHEYSISYDSTFNDHELSTIIEENGSFEQRDSNESNTSDGSHLTNGHHHNSSINRNEYSHETNNANENGSINIDAIEDDGHVIDDDDEIEREIYDNNENHNRSHELKIINPNHDLFNGVGGRDVNGSNFKNNQNFVENNGHYEEFNGHMNDYRNFDITNGVHYADIVDGRIDSPDLNSNGQLCESPLPPLPPPPPPPAPPLSDSGMSTPEPPPLPDDSMLNNYQQQQQKSPSKPWLFGQHKNPTVIQFSLKRSLTTNQIGFDMTEVQNMPGIYVNNTIPTCDAFEKLRRMDKLLDIDGYDFTRITLNEANHILNDVGMVFNVMVSRR